MKYIYTDRDLVIWDWVYTLYHEVVLSETGEVRELIFPGEMDIIEV